MGFGVWHKANRGFACQNASQDLKPVKIQKQYLPESPNPLMAHPDLQSGWNGFASLTRETEIVSFQKPKPPGFQAGTPRQAVALLISPLPTFPRCRPRTRGCCSGAALCAGHPVCRVFSSIRETCFRAGCVRLASARPYPDIVWHRSQS